MDTTSNLLTFVLLGGVGLIGLVAIVGLIFYARRERLLTHAERMKALEMGRDLPVDGAADAFEKTAGASVSGSPEGGPSLAAMCYTRTGWIAGCGLLFACWAGSGPTGSPPVAYAIAASAGAIGVTGMICGTVLAAKMLAIPAESRSSMRPMKPRYDPDAV